eukprot:555116_1
MGDTWSDLSQDIKRSCRCLPYDETSDGENDKHVKHQNGKIIAKPVMIQHQSTAEGWTSADDDDDLPHTHHAPRSQRVSSLVTPVTVKSMKSLDTQLQFDELAGIKLQLDPEIELYRNILNEA